MSERTTRSAVQAAALLILLRLFPFFCADAPYSAGHAAGMALAAAIQSALILPLIFSRKRLRIPPALRTALRIYAAFYAAVQTHLLLHFLKQMQLAAVPVMCLLALTLLFTVPLHDRAAARTASLLLCAAAIGFLLLPVSAVGTARRIFLYMPDSAAPAFFREWQSAGALPLLPLILVTQDESAARRSTLCWIAFRCIFLPGLVLFGAMQNGRLTAFSGNPFFLLLARAPLSDAVRTDGFWLLLTVAAGTLCITFCLQTAKPHLGNTAKETAAAFLPYCFFLALTALLPQAAAVFGTAAVIDNPIHS